MESQTRFAFNSVAGGLGAVAGAGYCSQFITEVEERDLLTTVDDQPWATELSRRVQHYGWRYDYKARTVRDDSYLGPLPEWLETFAVRVSATQSMGVADQVIINEYLPGQGIAAHTDCVACFGPVVAMLSLGADAQMDFIHEGRPRVSILCERRSLVVVRDSARFDWAHGIAKRKSDPLFGTRRGRRVSLTFRTVRAGS